jgi:serine/threonine-protein kinase RsbW
MFDRETTAPVVVRVPARPDVVHVLRAVASSIAARLDMPFDAIEEIRIAVDEASTLLLQLQTVNRATFVLELDGSDGALRVVLTAEAADGVWPPADLDDSWPWRVLRGLCDEVEAIRTDDAPALRFVKLSQVAGGSR